MKALGPDHVSLYVLEIEGKTALDHRARLGRVALPEDDLVADLFRRTVDALGETGLERYEISNFGRPGHASRHNTKYWDDVPFLRFGLAAHRYREGIDLDAFRRCYDLDPLRAYGAAFRDARDAGIAEVSEGRLRLTETGVLVSSELFQALVG